MASDQTVSARAVLTALMEVRRRGSKGVLEEFEQREPDLAAYLMENLTTIHHDLLKLRGDPQVTRRLYRDIEQMTLVCIQALHHGHHELWRSVHAPGSPGAQAHGDAGGNTGGDAGDSEHPST